MTLKYLGIFPASQYTGKKYERHLHHTETIKGKVVEFYEVVEIEDVKDPVSPSKSLIRELEEVMVMDSEPDADNASRDIFCPDGYYHLDQ